MDESNIDVLDYRLKSIEDEIKDLKGLLVQVPLLNGNLDNLEKRVSACETNIDLLNREVAKVKNEPVKKSAERWQYICDYAFKTMVTIGIAALLIKLGLKGV